MPKPYTPRPPVPIDWPRADPAALAAFDPATKLCTMNCGKAAGDPRGMAELKLLCDDCEPVEPTAVLPPEPTMNKPTTLEGARRQIDQVAKAMSQTEAVQLSTMARAWIACLRAENLIDWEAFRDLSIELNEQIDQAMTRFPGQRPVGE